MSHSQQRVAGIVFRVRLSIALVSLPFTLGFVGPYLYFDVLNRTIGRWCGVVEYVTQIAMVTIGSVVLNTAFGGSPDRTWLGREVLGSGGASFLRFLIGYAAMVGVVATILIAVEPRLDRAAVRRWMTHYFRFALAMVMLVYAIAKVVPTQFGFLTPADLVAPYASRNGFDVLWDFMAASTGYTVFSGLCELAGALLLCFRRTSVLGGLVMAAVMVNVLALNIAYRIVAVGAATTILAMDLALIGPELLSTLRFVLGERVAVPEIPAPLVTASWRPQWLVAKLVALALMLTPLVTLGVRQLHGYHGADDTWFGAYDVTAFDGGNELPDNLRWVRVASDGRYGKAGGSALRIQTADDRWHRFRSQLDTASRVMTLAPLDEQSASLRVRYTTDSAGVTLSTNIAGDSVRARLRPIVLERYAIFQQW